MHTKEEKESDILANANIYFDFVNVFFIRGFAFYCRLSILKVYFITQAPSQVEKHITKARRIQNWNAWLGKDGMWVSQGGDNVDVGISGFDVCSRIWGS